MGLDLLNMDILTYLHIATPIILLLPLLTLLPAPRAPQGELEGIRPITIQIITPRRTWILLTLVLLSITSLADCGVFAGRIATAQSRDEEFSKLELGAGVVYALGGFCIWGLTAVVTEWRTKWGDKGVTTLGVLGFVLEIPNLVFLVLREIHTDGPAKLFTILSIPPSALRLLLLPVLVVLVANPIVRFQSANESTSLLDSNGEPSRGRSAAYGTFQDDEGEDTNQQASSSANSTKAPTTPATGITPQPSQQLPKIPKMLGEVKREEKPLTTKEIFVRVRKLAPYLWPSASPKLQFYVVVCICALLVTRFGNPLMPIALGQTVRNLGSATSGEGTGHPWFWFTSYIGLRFLLGGNGIVSFTQNVLWVGVSQYTHREMQLLCFKHLLDLSFAYHARRNTGEVLKIIDRGSAINDLFQTMLFTAVPAVLDMSIAFGVFLWLYGPLLAFVVTTIMIVYIFFSVTQMNHRMKRRRQMIDRDIKQRGIVSDVLTNWESVKYFTAEQREIKRFTEAILSFQEAEANMNIGFQFIMLVQSWILVFGLAVGALIIAFRILNGQADAAEFIVFTQYYAQMQGPLDRFGWLYRILNQETTDAEKMFTLLSQATEVNDKPGAKELIVTDGVIEFEEVRFSYDGKVEALKGVSFRIGKGESMALVGESGSGKSTILRLLYRFYDISSGRILIDGQDISQVTQLSLRRAIGIVPQDSVLWNDSLGSNISYGREGATDEEIIGAAKAAKLHERIMSFPDNYSTIVGERGVRLSGGEKQRVSLARMFLKSPAILVLDEATSALDTETEREIQKALSDLAKGRSSLSIAHRLSTIINSDQIVVMKDGAVVERGTYKDLVDMEGAFATMWKKQIFTEAEMVAQAEGTTVDEAVKELPQQSNLVDLSAEAEKQVAQSVGDAFKVVKGTKKESEDAAGYPIPTQEDSGPSTYAEAVKAPADESEPGVAADGPGVHFEPLKDESSSSPAKDSPIGSQTDLTSPGSGAQTPASSKRASGVSFPNAPSSGRMPNSASQPSGLSRSSSRSNSDAPEPEQSAKDEKRRKRLSSIKGFVRRISDQGGMVRSNSTGGKSGPSSPLSEEAQPLISQEVEEGSKDSKDAKDGKKKKRLSLQRSKSDRKV